MEWYLPNVFCLLFSYFFGFLFLPASYVGKNQTVMTHFVQTKASLMHAHCFLQWSIKKVILKLLFFLKRTPKQLRNNFGTIPSLEAVFKPLMVQKDNISDLNPIFYH